MARTLEEKRSSRHSQAQTLHHVVPIGGSTFVPPALLFGEGVLDREKMPQMVESDSGSSTASSAISSASSSPTSSSHADIASMTGKERRGSNEQYEAALRYSSTMMDYTQQMWNRERMLIERARLETPSSGKSQGTKDGKSQSPSPPNANSSSAHNDTSPSGGLSALFRRKTVDSGNKGAQRRHRKLPSIS